MAKPIFIVRVPKEHADNKDPREIHKLISTAFNDEYHVFTVLGTYEDINFEVFNSDKVDPIELEKLKEILNAKD